MQTRKGRSEQPAAWKRIAGRERILQRAWEFFEQLPDYERIAMEEGLSDPIDSCVGSFCWDVYRLITSPPERTEPQKSEKKGGLIELKRAKAERDILRFAVRFHEAYAAWQRLLAENPFAEYGRKCLEDFAYNCLAAMKEARE